MTLDRFNDAKELSEKIKKTTEFIEHYENIKSKHNYASMKLIESSGFGASEVSYELTVIEDIQTEIIDILKKKLAIYQAEFDAL